MSFGDCREAINKVILEEQLEANNVTVDTLNPQRSKSEYLINKVANLAINDGVRKYLIEKFANLTINNEVGKYLI